jgi:hypothetical protein
VDGLPSTTRKDKEIIKGKEYKTFGFNGITYYFGNDSESIFYMKGCELEPFLNKKTFLGFNIPDSVKAQMQN